VLTLVSRASGSCRRRQEAGARLRHTGTSWAGPGPASRWRSSQRLVRCSTRTRFATRSPSAKCTCAPQQARFGVWTGPGAPGGAIHSLPFPVLPVVVPDPAIAPLVDAWPAGADAEVAGDPALAAQIAAVWCATGGRAAAWHADGVQAGEEQAQPWWPEPPAADAVEVRLRHEDNRRAWNEAAQQYRAKLDDAVEYLRAGGVHLHPLERQHLGDLGAWCELAVHLQCASGKDTLSLLNAGVARVVGVDIAEGHRERPAGQRTVGGGGELVPLRRARHPA